MIYRFLIIAFLLLNFQGFSSANSASITKDEPEVHLDLITVKILKVYDGDGCRALFPDGTIRKLRFANNDAPDFKNAWVGIDSTQPFAIASRDSLRKLILGKEVQIDTLPFGEVKYSYDRLLVDVYLPSKIDGEPLIYLNQYIVSKGWAWAVSSKKSQKRVNPFLYDLITAAFDSAKSSKQGLWKGKGRKFSPAYWRSNPWRSPNK